MIGVRKRVVAAGLAWALLGQSAWVHAGAGAQSKPPAGKIPGDEILGEWWTEGNEGRIRMTRDKEGYYRGTTTCCAHPHSEDNPAIDVNNPKPELRERSTVGIVLIWKLKFENGEYLDGYVYNPRDGKTYRMQMQVIDRETLKIRGYMGVPLLGQTQLWKRAHLDQKPTAATH